MAGSNSGRGITASRSRDQGLGIRDAGLALVGEAALDVPGAVAGFGVFYLCFDYIEECGHCGRDPLVLVPEDVGADVERRAVPVERFELVLAEFASDHDGG